LFASVRRFAIEIESRKNFDAARTHPIQMPYGLTESILGDANQFLLFRYK